MKKVKWGVIGAGGIARRRTIPEIVASAKKSQLVGVMDVNGKIAREVAQEFKVPFTARDERELLAQDDIDAVYIASPPNHHCRQVLLAAKAGKHVLCEKPLGMSARECERMIEACAQEGVKFMVAFMMRFQALHQKARDLGHR